MDKVNNNSILKTMRRLAGILVHPTSLPGKFGIGDLGPEAYHFVDFLEEAGQHLWQTLPLGPTGQFNCPYQCYSSFAGQPLLISPEILVKDGLLAESDIDNPPHFEEEKVDYDAVKEYKERLFKAAFENFQDLAAESELIRDFNSFRKENDWLDDYAMFMAIRKEKEESYWLTWEKKYRKPTKSQKTVIRRELIDQMIEEG